jgi:hypothetical protein
MFCITILLQQVYHKHFIECGHFQSTSFPNRHICNLFIKLKQIKCFSNPLQDFLEGRTYRQPEVVFISLSQATTGLRFACRARSVGGHSMQTISWIPGTLRGAFARATSQADMLACPFGDCRDNQQIYLLVQATMRRTLLRRGRLCKSISSKRHGIFSLLSRRTQQKVKLFSFTPNTDFTNT